MKVSQLAEKYNTTSEFVLKTLKSFRLKAKGSEQELSAAVVTVIKNVLDAQKKESPRGSASKEEKKAKKTAVKKVKTVKKKTAVKKTASKSTSAKTDEKVEKTDDEKKEKPRRKVKQIVRKKVVKKKTAGSSGLSAVEEKKAVEVNAEPKKKISKGPVITLKPLTRKRKKTSAKSEEQKSSDAKRQIKEGFALSATDISDQSNPSELTQESQISSADSQSPQEPQEQWARDESLPDMEIRVPITVKELSIKIQQKPSVVLKTLMKLGIMAHINQSLGGEMVSHITKAFGFNLAKIRTQEEQTIDFHKQEEENTQNLELRAPVVTFMGHVDHGKTSLIDKIRKSKVADVEHGGITQHMGAYSVKLSKGRITFLDTPGHEAFTAMRARGARITDLVVLVVSADEGMKPQTQEAIDHARAADVPIVVALNKIDRPNADIDRVKGQLAEVGLASEDWGGKTVVAGVSAMTGDGVDELLELILLEAELLELKANANKNASGIVVEAHLSQGKGVVTTLIVQSGTLKDGDVVVVGPYYGKMRALLDDHGHKIDKAGPSMPVEVLGLPDVPAPGEIFYVVDNEKQAREITLHRQEKLKNAKLQSQQKVTLEDLYSHLKEGAVKELNVILKSDVQGSLGALKDSLEKIPSDKVRIKFIHSGVGDINASDVLLAVASKATIIGFHVGIGPRAKEELEKEPVDVRQYSIIYDAVDDMRKALEGLLEAKQKKNFLSRIEIKEVFKLSKSGIVAGCYVAKGKVYRKSKMDIIRNDEVLFSGSISSLKRFKDDVKDVSEGMECGITIEGFDKIQVGDIIEAYEVESIVQKL